MEMATAIAISVPTVSAASVVVAALITRPRHRNHKNECATSKTCEARHETTLHQVKSMSSAMKEMKQEINSLYKIVNKTAQDVSYVLGILEKGGGKTE